MDAFTILLLPGDGFHAKNTKGHSRYAEAIDYGLCIDGSEKRWHALAPSLEVALH